MKTKFTKLSDLLGQEEKPKVKPIEFTQFMSNDRIVKPIKEPKEFKEVIYLASDIFGDYFLASNGGTQNNIYRGHLNDGFIGE